MFSTLPSHCFSFVSELQKESVAVVSARLEADPSEINRMVRISLFLLGVPMLTSYSLYVSILESPLLC